MSQPSKEDVVAALESIARILELKGENPFKIRAYTNAARALETFAGDLQKTVDQGRVREIPGIGEAIAGKIAGYCATGNLPYLDQIKSEFPPSLFQLFKLQGLGAKKIRALFEHLKVSSIESLEAACRSGAVAELAGFGEKTSANLLAAIDARAKHAGQYRFGDVAAEAESLLEDLRQHPAVDQVSLAGSYRRRKEIVHDLDFVASTRSPETVSSYFVTHPAVGSVIAKGATKSSVRLASGIQADLRVVTGEQYPFALNYFTGSKEHNIAMRGRALDRGWTLNEYRLGSVSGEGGTEGNPPVISEERDLYRALGLDYVEPEMRENLGEIRAAEAGELPDLIEWHDLRGTFHCHTTESDGRSTLEEMIAAADGLGLEYLGIADHSKSSFQARGLDETRLLAQRARIAALNEAGGDGGPWVFSGIECDILKDGSLDFSDEVLGQLDYVVASVHASMNLPEKEMTERIIRAVSNPHVTMLGHPTGRLLLSREPGKVNLEAVIEACAETGTWIELNGSPKRLDLDWRWWPEAIRRGAKCVINPDAHHVSGFQHLWFGVGVARKGWLKKSDVMNCLPLAKIRKALREKSGPINP